MKYSELSESAQNYAIQQYIAGWCETHPDEYLLPIDVNAILLEEDQNYNEEGQITLRQFDSLEKAFEWLEIHVDDPCIDNYRSARVNNSDEMLAFEEQAAHGCCGSCEVNVIVAGEEYVIGCNYGH